MKTTTALAVALILGAVVIVADEPDQAIVEAADSSHISEEASVANADEPDQVIVEAADASHISEKASVAIVGSIFGKAVDKIDGIEWEEGPGSEARNRGRVDKAFSNACSDIRVTDDATKMRITVPIALCICEHGSTRLKSTTDCSPSDLEELRTLRRATTTGTQ